MHLRTDTASNAHYAAVPQISHSRNRFSMAERHLTTMKYDYLFPIFHKYIYPGDTISIQQAIAARLTTQVAVLYDDLYFDVHAWCVPMRLLQTNWARYQFNTQVSGPSEDNSSLTSPSIDLAGLTTGFGAKTLYDYLGLPTGVNMSASTEHINNYAARAYNLIWNENYRDQNLQSPVTLNLDDGPDDPALYTLLKRGRRHDLFSSALPWQQKGTAPGIPLSGQAPVERVSNANQWGVYSQGTNTRATAGVGLATNATGLVNDAVTDSYSLDPNGGLTANLSSALAYMVINDLRTTISVQHLLEGDARGGTRDVESIQHRWGVTVPDYRLQRPEYLGGATFTFDGHIVPQTSESGTTPQGNLTQFSQTMSTFNVTHSFVEHSIMLILISARSNLTYQGGLQKEMSYRTRYDWMQPEFVNVGEVIVRNKEILYTTNNTINNQGWGYNEYGYELRYGLNRVSAEMRSNYAQSRDFQHMADDYGTTTPTLGPAWIQSNTDIDRNITTATSLADPVELNTLVKGSITRTLPMFSIPGLTRL